MPTITTVRQRGEFDRHPHQADVVGDQRQVHAEQHELVHRVVEAQIARRQAAGFQFVADIAGAERAGGEADEGGQHDEDDVQVVDQQVLAGGRAVATARRARTAATRRQATMLSARGRCGSPAATRQDRGARTAAISRIAATGSVIIARRHPAMRSRKAR